MDALEKNFNLVTRWLPFMLEGTAQSRESLPVILELRPPADRPFHTLEQLQREVFAAIDARTVQIAQRWLVDDVVKNLIVDAAVWHIGAESYRDGTRSAQTKLSEVEQWISSTQSLAARVPLTGIRDEMTRAAQYVRDALDWPSHYVKRPPNSFDTKPYADFRVNVNLWALDQLARAINEIEAAEADYRRRMLGVPETEHLKIEHTKWWPHLFGRCWPPDRAQPPFADYLAAKNRVTGFEKNILDGKADRLMVHVLNHVFHHGRYRPQHDSSSQIARIH